MEKKSKKLIKFPKLLILLTILCIHISVFPNNHPSDCNEIQTIDSISKSKPTHKLKPANRFTTLDAGVANIGVVKCSFGTLTEVKPWFSYGFGFGVRYSFQEEQTIVPLFIVLQTGIKTNGKVAPYISAKTGYALGGGFLLNPEIGIRIKSTGKKSFFIAAGYEYQQVGQDYYDKDVESSIGLTVGMRF